MAASVSFAGLFALNTMNSNSTVHAATTANDPEVVTVNYVPGYGIAVWNGTDLNTAHTTGQKLSHATSWKVTDSKYDAQGNKWYDLGLDQWVMAKWTRSGLRSVNPNVRFDYVAPTTTQAPAAQSNTQSTYANNSASSYNYSAQNTQTYSQPARSYSNYTSNATGSEASAKAWIAARESGGSYSARNGQYIGKYQLSASYLNGDYSAANQERVADNYVKSRYGSWSNAQSFWQANGWY
ncbi:hypothetical protein [uncultured Lactobacillus sp.]|uniref:aggregation-promoting factor n=1 Tax=uncultured Lactobacillus sp. TaxID=153152 RepID=UPI0026021BBB|nr:hypothetical protein [uncultured Lactobacillus sp.]